jgi:hypothetical protein
MRIGLVGSERMIDDLLGRELRERRRVLAELVDLDLEARPRRREDAEALLLEVADPGAPALRRHPHAVDQDDGVRSGRGRGGQHGVLRLVRRFVSVSDEPTMPIPSASQ